MEGKGMTVHEVSKRTGVSIRTLQYYDRIGLLPPAAHTEAGYRLYDEAALERLQQILLFRELEFPLREIRAIISRPDFDREKALAQQIELLTLRRDRLNGLIRLAEELKETGGRKLDFKAFDTEKMDDYARRAKAQWGETEAYREYEQRSRNWTGEDTRSIAGEIMEIFREFGEMKDQAPDSPRALAQVRKLQDYISARMYTCTDEILASLGEAYGSGGEFTKNIDAAGGPGTGAFAAAAIRAYCRKD